MTAIKAGRDLIERFDGSPRRDVKLPLAIAAAGLAAGYLIGRRSARPAAIEEPNGVGSPPAEPAMEVATAVEVSRPQAAELDEIVPENGASAGAAAPNSGAKT
jgi:hypothetical protein